MNNTEQDPTETERLRLMAEVRNESAELEKTVARLEAQKAGIDRALSKHRDQLAKNRLLLANHAPGYVTPPKPAKPPLPKFFA